MQISDVRRCVSVFTYRSLTIPKHLPATMNDIGIADESAAYRAKQAEDFAHADIQAVLDKLTTSEKIAMLAGADWWNTVAIPRLVRLRDAFCMRFGSQTSFLALPS